MPTQPPENTIGSAAPQGVPELCERSALGAHGRPAASLVNGHRWMIAAVQILCVLVFFLYSCARIAEAQQPLSIYPDDSISNRAREALPRVRELAEAGNVSEAARVLQELLEEEAEKVLETTPRGDLFHSVRSLSHELLLSNPALLAKYRSTESPRAEKLLESGKEVEVERSRFLTRPGAIAALRIAQTELDAARFESARLMLTQLVPHPDRASDRAIARDAARLASELARYLPRPSVARLSSDFIAHARSLGEHGVPVLPPVPVPAAAMVESRSPLDPAESLDATTIPRKAVQSVRIKPPIDPALAEAESQDASANPEAFPSTVGELVLVNDGERITAYDRDTLGLIWRTSPEFPLPAQSPEAELMNFRNQMSRDAEDALHAASARGVVVAATERTTLTGQRAGDARIHGLDAETGKILWSVLVSALDSTKLTTAAAKGPAVIDADTAVLCIRKPGAWNRVTSLYLVGLDLYTGRKKWMRLVASVGRLPWGQFQRRTDAMVLHEGVVFRADEMGVCGAYEAATGRPVWVKRMSPNRALEMRIRRPDTAPPHAVQQPVIHGDSIIIQEPGDADIIRLSLATGELIGRRDAGQLGNPQYLLKVGGYLAGVGKDRITFVRIDEFASGVVRATPTFSDPGLSGRVIVTGEHLFAPHGNGASVIDPATASITARIDLESGGNLLVAGGHLLGADARHLRTFIGWNQARELLGRRIASRPGDVTPLLTFIELADRAGAASEIPDKADRAIELIEAAQRGSSPDTLATQRERLFSLILEITRSLRRDGGKSASAEIGERLLRSLFRAAETPSQRVSYLFEVAAWREAANDGRRAVEAYQEILADTVLSETAVPGDSPVPEAPGPAEQAGVLAAAKLTDLVARLGYAPYAPFDEEAARAVAALPATARIEVVRDLALRYPLAKSTPELWHRVARAELAANRPRQATLAMGLGLRAAESALRAGAMEQAAWVGRLGGELFAALRDKGQAASAYRLLRRLSEQHPGLVLMAGDRPVDVGSSLDALLDGALRVPPLPSIGVRPTGGVQILPGWLIVEPLISAGWPSDCVMMENDGDGLVGLFAVNPTDDRLAPLWTRTINNSPPTLITSTLDVSYVFWPSPEGGSIEAIDCITGRTLWKTPEFVTLFEGGANAGRRGMEERFPTPAGGEVRAADLLVSLEGSTVVLVERAGRAAAFSVADGKPLWRTALTISRVYDIASGDDSLVVGGETPVQARAGAENPASPLLVTIDKRTGREIARIGFSDNARENPLGDHLRWLRSGGGGWVIVGLGDGVLKFKASTGEVAWTSRGQGVRNPAMGFVLSDQLFVLDGDRRLWLYSLATGMVGTQALETRQKIDFPLGVSRSGDNLLLTSTAGMLVYDKAGRLIGSDSLNPDGELLAPVAADGLVVTVGHGQTIRGMPADGQAPAPIATLYVLSAATGSLLAREGIVMHEDPFAVAVVDGKILISQGPLTLVLDAPK